MPCVGEELEQLETRVVRPRRTVEAFDDASHLERPLATRLGYAAARVGTAATRPSNVEGDESMTATERDARRARGARAGPARQGRGRSSTAAAAARASTTTFAELNALVNRLANGCAPRARASGERLVWCGPNSLEVLATIHAAAQARPRRGAALVPLHRRGDGVRHRQLRRDDRRRRRRAGAARRRRCAATSRRCARSSCSAVPVPDGCTAWDDAARRAARTEPAGPRTPSEAGAAMIYTSGTTGQAEGRAAHTDRPRRSCSRCSAS